MSMIDYALRAGYLLSLAGGNISELSRMTGTSRRNLRRVLMGRDTADPNSTPYTPSTKVKRQINLQFNLRATDNAKRQEKVPRGKKYRETKDPKDALHRVQPKLLKEVEARRLELAFQRMNLYYIVQCRLAVVYYEVLRDDMQTENMDETLFSKKVGSVDEAKDNLTETIEKWENADRSMGEYIRVIVDPEPPLTNHYLYRVYRPLNE